MKTKLLLLFFALVLSGKLAFAAAPSWTVNPAAFAYSMTVTAVAEVNCTELTSPSNRIGAFVGNDCRGTALTSTIVNGRYIASMVVYSNAASGETVTFRIYNASNDSVYEARTTAAFQDDASYGVSSSPFAIRNNNAPTALNLGMQHIDEGLPVNSVVGTFGTTDPDASETFTYTLVSGAGSADNANFAISGNNLVTNTVLNYAAKSSHSIRIRSTDANLCYIERTFTITVNDVNTAPTGILISDSTINENSPALTVIGTLSALDYDANESYTYALVSGTGSTDNASFNINGTSLRSLSAFNYEAKPSYSIRIRVTDVASNTYERVFTILVKDVNDAPTSISINGSTTGIDFTENRPLGSVIGLLSTVDEDTANTFIYSFVNTAGNNNDKFTISGNQLRTNDLFDYETRQNYVVFIQTNDGHGGLLTRQFALNVTDSNDAPTSISLTNAGISENMPAGTFIGRLTTVDPDAVSNFAYAFVTGPGSGGNSNFRISNDSLYSHVSFDYESVTSYTIRVNVHDGFGGNYQQTLNISISNANDAPTDINLSSDQVAENQPSNTIIGSLSTNDQDAGNTFVYTLVAGTGSTDNASFNISGSNLRASVSFDYEAKDSYSIRLRTTDNQGAWFEKVFTIHVTNLPDAPTNITLSHDTISENRSLNTLIGTFESVSQDTALTFTYGFDNNISGNNNSFFTITGNQLRSNAMFDYETKSSYFIYVVSNDGAGGTFTKQFQINIINRNDAPTDIILNNNSVSENQPAGTFISRLSTTDPDNSTSFTYSLVSGVGATDNASFTVKDDSLLTNASFDFETKNLYSIRLQTNDGNGGIFQKIITISIANINDDPTNITLSETSVNENLPANTTIGTFTTTDQDTASTFTYSLVSGTGSTDNGSFIISGNALRTTSVLDYEAKSSYSIRVRTIDNLGGYFERSFVITVNNMNDAPSDIALSNDTVVENRPLNSLIGTFTTTDQDAGNTFTYSFAGISGNSNQLFTISGNQLRTNHAFNYEETATYFIYIQTNDGHGGTYTKQFQINIKDSNDAPTDISLSISSINENKPAGTFIGVFSSTDPDPGNTFTYALVSGTGSTHNSSFTLSNDSLFSAEVLNFEVQSTYSIRVRTTDNMGLSFQKVFTITVNDSNDFPTAINLSSAAISENMPLGSTVGTFSTVDADAGQTFTYSLVSGPGSTNNNVFSIQNGVLKTNAVFNYEVKNEYTIRVQTNDGNGGTFTDTFRITINDANDAPTNITLSNNTIPENRPIGSLIGTLSTTDEDANSFTYSFVSTGNNDNASFILSGNELKTNTATNYESKQLYVVNIQTDDGFGGTFARQFLIYITDSNDAPTDVSLSNNTIDENEPAHTFIGTLSISDVDQVQGTNTYQLVNGTGSNHNNRFVISNDSLYSSASFNYEVQNAYTIRIRATDHGGLFIEKSFIINVLDANDAPTALALSGSIIKENSLVRTLIGRFTTTDADASDNFTYSLVAGSGSADNASFIITGNELRSNSVFNKEVKDAYSIRVQTNDNRGGTFEQAFTVTVEDSNDVPTNITLSNNTIAENRGLASIVGTFTTTDEDAGDFHVYSLASITGNDNSSFFINGNELRTNTNFDYETKRVYNIYVQTNDGYSTFTKQFVINITDSNDAPVALILTSNRVDENLAPGAFIGMLQTSDPDISETFTYSLVNGTGSVDNASFRISNDSIYTNTIFNYEQKASYSIRVRSTDNGGLWIESTFSILINDANDAPTDIMLSTNEISENRPNRSLVAMLSTKDADANTFTYSLVSGTGSTDNASFVIIGSELRSNRIFNFENKASYDIRIQTNDGNGGTFEKAFTINILDSNDVPANIVLSASSVPENAPLGTRVCDLSTIDEDQDEQFTYSFVNVSGNFNNQFMIVGDQLRTNSVFDFETKNFYLIHLQVTDRAGASITRQFIIDIRDTNDAPVSLDLGNLNVDENRPTGSLVGRLTSADPDAGDHATYSLVNGPGSADNAGFTIVNDSLLTSAVFNYENKSSYQVRIRVSDSRQASFDRQFVITINDMNDAPTLLSLSSSTLIERSPAGTIIGTLSTTDEDASDLYTYTFTNGTGGTDNNSFFIIGDKLFNSFVPDFETKNTYSIRVKSTDKGGDSTINTFTITIRDTGEKPSIGDYRFYVSEHADSATVVGTVSGSSPDAGANLKYALLDAASLPFLINEITGEITVSGSLDYETRSSYQIRLLVKDDQEYPLFDTSSLVIVVTDEIETRNELPANNFMSPNGDGRNDYFAIANVHLYSDYSLTIYNESGMEVYKVAGSYNNEWDGTYNGKALPTGVYFYVFHNSKTGDEFKGAINIIR